MDELIPVPTFGWVYRLTFECGHKILAGDVSRYSVCPCCGMWLHEHPEFVTLHRG